MRESHEQSRFLSRGIADEEDKITSRRVPVIVLEIIVPSLLSYGKRCRSFQTVNRKRINNPSSGCRGMRSKEIAFDMGVTERTIKAHLTQIYNKLGVDSRSEAEAIAVSLEKGILHL